MCAVVPKSHVSMLLFSSDFSLKRKKSLLSVGHPGPSFFSPHSSESSVPQSQLTPKQHCGAWCRRQPHSPGGGRWWGVPGADISPGLVSGCVCAVSPGLPGRVPEVWDLVPGHIPMPTLHRVPRGTPPSIFLSSESGFSNLQQYFHCRSSFP